MHPLKFHSFSATHCLQYSETPLSRHISLKLKFYEYKFAVNATLVQTKGLLSSTFLQPEE